MAKKDKIAAKQRRKHSIRKRVSGDASRPRLSVFRSAKHIYAQVVDDQSDKSVAAASTLTKVLNSELQSCKSKCDRAKLVGMSVAKACLSQGVSQVVFDRNGYLYHGRVKALADGAREAGLQF